MQDPLDRDSYMQLWTTFIENVGDLQDAILGGRQPPIAEEEENLPRKTRVDLAQLRSGWSNRLNSYWSRIDRAVPNSCPTCDQNPYDTVPF